MLQNRLEKYASLIVKTGINIQKGEEVFINAQLDQIEFVRLLVETFYKEGAKEVRVKFSDDKIARLHYKYQTVGTLGKLKSFDVEKYKYMSKKLPAILHLISEDPDAFKGINQSKIAKSRVKSYSKIKKYRDAMDGKYKWCIAAVPNIAWAKKIFPKLSDSEAVDKLWDSILLTARVDENDPNDNWKLHNDNLIEKRTKLELLQLVSLEYRSNNGTDFKVGLNPKVKWGAGIEKAENKSLYNPNIPTEEVFTTPVAGKAEGKVVASMPLCYQGELIEDFSLTFKDGKVVSVEAKKNQKLLETMVNMDETACMLGEVALVPYSSPIRQTNILFYNTLFDENAVCHLALGAGFIELYPDGINMTKEQLKEAGINDSMIHVDFMIGTQDLTIIGETINKEKVIIFKDGEWAI